MPSQGQLEAQELAGESLAVIHPSGKANRGKQ